MRRSLPTWIRALLAGLVLVVALPRAARAIPVDQDGTIQRGVRADASVRLGANDGFPPSAYATSLESLQDMKEALRQSPTSQPAQLSHTTNIHAGALRNQIGLLRDRSDVGLQIECVL